MTDNERMAQENSAFLKKRTKKLFPLSRPKRLGASRTPHRLEARLGTKVFCFFFSKKKPLPSFASNTVIAIRFSAAQQRRAPALLAVLAVILDLSVSVNLLTWLGVPYVDQGGWPIFKLRPGSFAVAFAFVAFALPNGALSRATWHLVVNDRLLAIFLAAMTYCVVAAWLMTGTGNLAVLLDTFLPAGLLAYVLGGMTPRQMRWLRALLQTGIALNAALAIGETAAHATLLPGYNYAVEGGYAETEFRPVALYDHPLAGAAITMMGLALVPARQMLRAPYVALLSAALIAFGGRVALAVAVLGAVARWLAHTANLALRRDPRLVTAMLSGAIAVSIGLLLAGVSLQFGLGGRLFSHLYWDPSAQVRLAQWNLLGLLDTPQLLFGTQRADILARLTPLHLAYGVGVIENFWLLMFASLGLLGFPVFLAGIVALLLACCRRAGWPGVVLVTGGMAIVSASNSLGSKSVLLVLLVASSYAIPHAEPICCATGRLLGLRRPPAVFAL